MSIVLSIVTDANLKGIKSVIKEFESLKTASQKASFAISQVALPAAAGFSAAAAGIFKATQAASDLAEQSNQIKVVFGSASEQVLRFAANAAQSIGQSQTQALSAASTFASLGKAAGLSGTDLATFSTDFTVLASDLASFKNTTPEQAITAIGAALRGESEPIRQFGVLLDDVTLKNRAFALGLIESTTTALTPQIRVLAAQAEIMAQTTDAQGDFSRTSKGAANQQKILKAQLSDTVAELGAGFLPILETVVPLLSKMAKFVKQNSTEAAALLTAFTLITGGLVLLKGGMIAYRAVAVATTLVNKALAVSGFAVQISTGVGVVAAIAGAAALATITYQVMNSTNANNDYANSASGAAAATDELTAAALRGQGTQAFFDYWSYDATATRAAQTKAAAAAATTANKIKQAQDKAKSAAKELFDATKRALEQAKESLQQYADGIADAVRGWVSLTTAVAEATNSEGKYQDALKERMTAYEELNKLQKSGLYTTEQMAAATERVTAAENNLNTAQSQRKTYSQQFAEQIASAKKFSSQLQQLIGIGLQKAGLAQLLNLGPVAGSQVAADLLTGAGGMTVGSLNADLAELDAAGIGLGTSAIAGDMSLLNQAKAVKTGTTVNITVTSADPASVVAALQKYVRTSGPVPIKIRNP
jgi:hypothetical protein